MLEDKFSVACLVAIELKAGLVGDQRLKQRLAFDELKVPDVTAIKVQEVERIVDEPLAVSCRLRSRKVRQSGVVVAAEFAVKIGGLHFQIRGRRDGARVFSGSVRPVRVRSCTRPLSMPRGHTIGVELNLVQPLRPRGRLGY